MSEAAPQESKDTTTGDFVVMIGDFTKALEQIPTALNSLHQVGIRYVAASVVIAVIFMIVLSAVICLVVWRVEDRMATRYSDIDRKVDLMPGEVAKALHIEQNQRIFIEPGGSGHDDRVQKQIEWLRQRDSKNAN